METLNEPVIALETLLENITDYLKEYAKCISGVICYDSPNKTVNITQDLYDGILTNIATTKTCVTEAYLAWYKNVSRFSQLIHSDDFTPQERTVLIFKYIDGKLPGQIMNETGYPDVNKLISSAEAKVPSAIAKITSSLPASPASSVKAFLEEVLPQISINCIPNQLLFDLYTNWSKQTKHYNYYEHIHGKNKFLAEVRKQICPAVHGWRDSTVNPSRVKKIEISAEEPMLHKYNCEAWMKNPVTDRTHLKEIGETVRGLFRC